MPMSPATAVIGTRVALRAMSRAVGWLPSVTVVDGPDVWLAFAAPRSWSPGSHSRLERAS